jgi:Ca-activated chloride channel family protein
MSFASPELLLGLLLIPLGVAAYLWFQRRRSRYAVRFTNVALLSNIVPKAPAWRRHVPPAFYLTAIGALVLALARPSMVMAVPREEATVILTMDVSGSMMATDVAPSRLAAAQQAAADFVDQLPAKFKIGLVAFSTAPRVLVSPTTDHQAILDALTDLRPQGGTALGDAIEVSLEAAGLDPNAPIGATPSPSATPDSSASADPSAAPSADPSASASTDPAQQPLVATVLLSDGANSTGETEPIDAASDAAALNVPVYTIALGTRDGRVTVPDPQSGQMVTVDVPPDTETLAQVAEMTNARFFEAPTADQLKQIYDSLGSKVGYTQEEQEVTQAFAAAGLLFVLGGAGLAMLWFNRFP